MIFFFFLNFRYETGGTATPENLWDAFDEQLDFEERSLPDNLTIASVMKGWTDQSGYPLITVTRRSNADAVDVEIKQVRR